MNKFILTFVLALSIGSMVIVAKLFGVATAVVTTAVAAS